MGLFLHNKLAYARAGCGGESRKLVTGNWTVESRYFLLIFGGHAPHAGSALASSMQVRYYSCKIAGHIVQPSRVAGAPSSTPFGYLVLCTGTLFYTCLLGEVGERGTEREGGRLRDKRVLQLPAKISPTTPPHHHPYTSVPSTSQTYLQHSFAVY